MASVGDIVTRDAALFITNDSAGFFCPGNFSEDQLVQIRKRLESVSRSSGRESNPGSNDSFETQHFADGSFAFLIPLTHNDSLEAVLCLKGDKMGDFDHLRRHLISLSPIFRLAAVSIVHARETEDEAHDFGVRPIGEPVHNAMSQLVSALLRNLSHHIRTPITAVRGYAKMMLEGRTGPLSDSQRECLRMALVGSEQLAETAATVSKASDRINRLHPEILDGRSLWLAVLSDARPQLVAGRIKLKENVPLEGGSICCDRKEIVHTLERLLAHAIRIVELDGTFQVDLRCHHDFTLKLTIPGPGPWPDSEMEMSALQEIVFLHGGQVFSTISKEKGLAFTLTLPGYAE